MGREEQHDALEPLTPERLERLIRSLARASAPGQPVAVGFQSLAAHLLEKQGLKGGPARLEAYLRLKAEIPPLIDRIPAMRYVYGSE